MGAWSLAGRGKGMGSGGTRQEGRKCTLLNVCLLESATRVREHRQATTPNFLQQGNGVSPFGGRREHCGSLFRDQAPEESGVGMRVGGAHPRRDVGHHAVRVSVLNPDIRVQACQCALENVRDLCERGGSCGSGYHSVERSGVVLVEERTSAVEFFLECEE